MKTLLTCTMLALGTAFAAAQEAPAWPQFRGPGGSGVAEGQKPPIEFGPDKNVKWKIATPSGFSSPIVVGDLVVLTAFDKGKLYTIAYRRANGAEAWRVEAPAKEIERHHKTEASPAASTPVTDGKRIVSYFGSCGVFCCDLAGKELWRHEMPTVETLAGFGTGVSPILADGLVVLVRDAVNDSKIFALDVTDGSLKWEKKREKSGGFCTPALWSHADGKDIVVPGTGRMIGYDLKTGDEKWTVSGMPAVVCATPVVSGDMLFFAGWSPGDDFKLPTFDDMLKMTGQEKLGHITQEGFDKTKMKGFFDNNDTNHDGKITRDEWDASLKMMSSSVNCAIAVKAGGRGDITKSHVIWKQLKGLPYVPSGVAYQGQYVLVKDGGFVTAYDMRTGKKIYAQERVLAEGRYYASPVAANGHIYCTSLDDGTITVLKAGGTEPTVAARNPELKERVAATPAIADNVIYVRTAGHLYAFAE
jgi:outer membrane protein assembly factor BamB